MDEAQEQTKRQQDRLHQGDGLKAPSEAAVAETAAMAATKSRFQAILRQYKNMYFAYSLN